MQATGAAEDWITIWESELAGLACDVEMREAWQAAIGSWASRARVAVAWQALVPPGDAAAGPAGAGAQAGSTTFAAAPDAGLATGADLAQRVAELERRLAALAGHAGGT